MNQTSIPLNRGGRVVENRLHTRTRIETAGHDQGEA